MKTKLTFLCFFLTIAVYSLSAQEPTSTKANSFNFPAKRYGISLGNSSVFSGVRINYADKNVKETNGLNLTFWVRRAQNMEAVSNGLNIGVVPTSGWMNGLNLGLLATGSAKMSNGITFGGFVIGSGGNLNGITVSSLLIMSDSKAATINGITISSFIWSGKSINGLTGSVWINSEDKQNGLALSLVGINTKNSYSGIGITCGYFHTQNFKGFSIAGYSKTTQMNGLSVALFNQTKKLKGIQVGLINCAENNARFSRILPFINMNLKGDPN